MSVAIWLIRQAAKHTNELAKLMEKVNELHMWKESCVGQIEQLSLDEEMRGSF